MHRIPRKAHNVPYLTHYVNFGPTVDPIVPERDPPPSPPTPLHTTLT